MKGKRVGYSIGKNLAKKEIEFERRIEKEYRSDQKVEREYQKILKFIAKMDKLDAEKKIKQEKNIENTNTLDK